MRHLFSLLIFIYSTLLIAQQTSKVSPPLIVAKMPFGETVIFENSSISFLKVIEDSRCPSEVTCIWAGEAIVIVTIKTEIETIEKQLIFHGTDFGSESENTLLVSNSKKYIGYRLSPYPETSLPLTQREYFLEVFIK